MMTDLHLHGLPFDSRDDASIEDWTARQNLANQDRLFGSFCVAADDMGLSIETIAERLGIPADEARSIMKGEIDLTLHDLQLVSAALTVVLDYRVMPAASAKRLWLSKLAAKRPIGHHRAERKPTEHVWAPVRRAWDESARR